jgi:hypothetical protein
MKSLVAVALGATALSFVAPAATSALAQSAPPPPVASAPAFAVGPWSLERREGWMRDRIIRARADGSLTPHDADRAQHGLDDVMAMQARFVREAGGRLRDSDRRTLEDRLDQLSDSVKWAHREDAPPWRR